MQYEQELTMPDEPLVSICIPTYNRAGMIGRAIESALGQTYRNIEVIVVDNASIDNTEAVVAEFTDERFSYIKNERNLGLFGNFNRCIELATGKYLHILHSDDYIDPDFTLRCVSFFQEHPSVVMTSTGACIVNEGFKKNLIFSDTDIVYAAPEGFRRLLNTRSYITCPSVMVLRDMYQEVGLFSLEYPYSSDFYQWLRIARCHDIGYVSGVCVFYRMGEHSETYRFLYSSPRGYLDMLRMFIQLQLDLGKEFDQYAVEFLSAQRRFIYDCLFAGFMRGDTMPGFSPLVFIGFSLGCWTLEKPVSVAGWFSKLRDLVVILPAGLLMSWSLTRWIVRELLFSKDEIY
jgi:glycosyltransferase involved in cell wall biosynthesis